VSSPEQSHLNLYVCHRHSTASPQQQLSCLLQPFSFCPRAHPTVGPGSIGPSGSPWGPPTTVPGPVSYNDTYYACGEARDREREREGDRGPDWDRERDARDREREQEREREGERERPTDQRDAKLPKTERIKIDHFTPHFARSPSWIIFFPNPHFSSFYIPF
jgi:hypothetical protein